MRRGQMIRILGVLGLALIGTSASAAPAPDAVPFELYKGHIFVSAYVNGSGPYRFGFDTGASGDGRADVQLTRALSLPKAGEGETTDGIRTATADLVSIRSLRLGPIEKRDLEVLSRDYNGGRNDDRSIMGIIGRDFFADWLVTIDYRRRKIEFKRGQLRRSGNGVVAYGPSFSVPVCFDRKCFPGKIDTGSSRSIVVPREVAHRLAATDPVKVGEAKRMNSTAALYEVSLKGRLLVSGITLRAPKVLYAEPSDQSINVGSDFLKDYVLRIDQVRQLLSIQRR